MYIVIPRATTRKIRQGHITLKKLINKNGISSKNYSVKLRDCGKVETEKQKIDEINNK